MQLNFQHHVQSSNLAKSFANVTSQSASIWYPEHGTAKRYFLVLT